MSNMEVTNNNPRTIVVFDPIFDDNVITATGAVTYVAGTLLGRITIGGKLAAYASGASDGSETPVSVLHSEQVFAGAGDAAIRPIISGRILRDDLVAHGVGAITTAEADQLRDYSIIAQSADALAQFDNQ